MAVIYLRHIRHGAKVACLEQEAVADEANGWVRYTPGAPSEPVDTPNSMIPRKRRTLTVSEGTIWQQPEK
jgi:hypothetical protein